MFGRSRGSLFIIPFEMMELVGTEVRRAQTCHGVKILADTYLWPLLFFGHMTRMPLLVSYRYAGAMERLQAETELINRLNSTYLVRLRTKESGEYAISIK